MPDEHERGRYVNPAALSAPIGYSNGVSLPFGDRGRVLFLAGQIGCDGTGRIVSGRLAEQFDQALANLLEVVREAGGGPEAIGKLTIFVIDKAEYVGARREIGDGWRRRMGRHYPAITLVQVSALLDPHALVEIDGVAIL